MMIFPCGYHHVAAHSHHREPLANARPENHGIYNVTGNCCNSSNLDAIEFRIPTIDRSADCECATSAKL